MRTSLPLGGPWLIRGFDGQHGVPEAWCGPEADERTFLPARVPGEVHLDLERAGMLPDLNAGLHAQNARWVEEQVWVYRTRFTVPRQARSAAQVWLVFEGLDYGAVILLNGEEIGSSANAFLPCRIPIKDRLRAGENVLAVRLESGLYSVSERPGTVYNPSLDHLLHKRSWLRKPQYSFSWDWSPRLVNVGIWRPVYLEWAQTARLEAATVTPALAPDLTEATLNVGLLVENVTGAGLPAILQAAAPDAGVEERLEVTLPPGLSRHHLALRVTDPWLWWPQGHGDQNLYDVRVEILARGEVADSASRRTGIRSVALNQEPHPDGGEYFILEVNGRPIFAKGGNWVPPDIIYGRPDTGRFRRLVEMAVEANFNTLRVWGGGPYANHALLEACDNLGVMVWHDFPFACSKYPADDPGFLESVRREIAHNVRDLAHHPSLLVWCGNNELEWGAWEWGYDRGKAYPDYALYHHEIPAILEREDPSRPYWPSSPYSKGHRPPNDPTTGDQHPWHVTLGEDGPDFWAYRTDVSRFPNEGGVLGVSTPATLEQFLPSDQRALYSPVWEFHDNACNYHPEGGIAYRTLEYWLGCQPDELPFPDYCFYSALLQAEGLQEYAHNFRRRMFSSASAIFWMYNDCWPASHGWSIVDYYLRRKLAYHPVRRAFAPVHVIPVVEKDEVLIVGVNDTPRQWAGEVRWGLFTLAGKLPVDLLRNARLPANHATTLASLPLAHWQRLGYEEAGCFALLGRGERIIAQNRLFLARFKDLRLAAPQIKVERRGEALAFSSPTYVWGVCLEPEGAGSVPDDVFDLLPSIEYRIPWPKERPIPKVQRTGSPLPTGPRRRR